MTQGILDTEASELWPDRPAYLFDQIEDRPDLYAECTPEARSAIWARRLHASD